MTPQIEVGDNQWRGVPVKRTDLNLSHLCSYHPPVIGEPLSRHHHKLNTQRRGRRKRKWLLEPRTSNSRFVVVFRLLWRYTTREHQLLWQPRWSISAAAAARAGGWGAGL